jgi:hypothetical protein
MGHDCVTDAETIATRSARWDPATEVSRSTRDAAALAAEQAEVLARAQERLDELIGLEGPKEQIAVWRTEIQIDQLLAAEAGRLRSIATESGTALDVESNGRYARKVVIACKRERARRLHTVAPAELAERQHRPVATGGQPPTTWPGVSVRTRGAGQAGGVLNIDDRRC